MPQNWRGEETTSRGNFLLKLILDKVTLMTCLSMERRVVEDRVHAGRAYVIEGT